MNTHHQHKLPPGQSYGYDQAVKINDQAKELRAKNKSINKTLNKVKHLSLLQLLRMWLKNY